jgi:hypothetical protein
MTGLEEEGDDDEIELLTSSRANLTQDTCVVGPHEGMTRALGNLLRYGQLDDDERIDPSSNEKDEVRFVGISQADRDQGRSAVVPEQGLQQASHENTPSNLDTDDQQHHPPLRERRSESRSSSIVNDVYRNLRHQ